LLQDRNHPSVAVVIGVAGAGKTTVGKRLAKRRNREFAEGDQFHPLENVAKMQSGHPLTDAAGRPGSPPEGGYFMPASLLGSQFAGLEPPGPDENPITVPIDQPVDQIARQIAEGCKQRGTTHLHRVNRVAGRR
jgi:gluconate kinase